MSLFKGLSISTGAWERRLRRLYCILLPKYQEKKESKTRGRELMNVSACCCSRIENSGIKTDGKLRVCHESISDGHSIRLWFSF